jgi:Tfp pilus assembly protein PilV
MRGACQVWRIPRRLRWGGASGFALLETVIALVLLEIVGMAAVGLISVSLRVENYSKQGVLAEQAAASQIESIRQLPYSSVGTLDGNPGGTVQPTMAISMSGLSATETTQIKWVNDPTPTAFTTRADYKRVTVTVNRSTDGRQLTQQTTYVGPSTQASYGGLSKALAQVQVIDMGTNQPLANVPVSLTTGPSAPLSDVTDNSGTVIFPALTANPASGGQSYYNLAITPPVGYTALIDDISPSAAAHTHLSVDQTFNTVLRVYQPSTVGFTVVNAGGGGGFTGNVTVTMTSSLAPVTTSFTGSTGSLSTVAPAQYTISATTTNSGTGWAQGVTSAAVVQTVPISYPTNLTSAFTLTLPYLVVTVKKSVSGVCQVVPGATVTLTGGPSGVNMSLTAGANGQAAFVAPAGGSYTIKAVSGGTNKTLTAQTVLAAPTATAITNSISGSCP